MAEKKKKGGKGKKGKKGKKSDKKKANLNVIPVKIDFSKDYIGQENLIHIKIKHKQESHIILTDEFKKSLHIKEELSKLMSIPIENMKLFYNNKRPIEDEVMNHDQQIKNLTILYLTVKNSTNEWENINDIISFKEE